MVYLHMGQWLLDSAAYMHPLAATLLMDASVAFYRPPEAYLSAYERRLSSGYCE